MILKGTTYEETSLVLLRLRGGTADARRRSGQSRRREGTVRDRSRGLPGQGGSHDRGVVSAGRTRRGPSARRACVRLRARRPDRYAVERPTCGHAQGGADVLRGAHRCSRRGAQRQQHGASQVRCGAAEGQGGSHPHAGERMMLGTVRPVPLCPRVVARNRSSLAFGNLFADTKRERQEREKRANSDRYFRIRFMVDGGRLSEGTKRQTLTTRCGCQSPNSPFGSHQAI